MMGRNGGRRHAGGWPRIIAAFAVSAAVATMLFVPAHSGESQELWVRTFDSGGGNDSVVGVGADPGGGVVSVSNLATGGIRASRYSREGVLTWSFLLPDVSIPLDRYFFNMNPAFFPDGDVLILGQVASGAAKDLYVGRYRSSTGARVWDNTYDIAGDESPRRGLVDSSGNILVVGETLDPGPDPDIFVAKIDAASREILWTATYEGFAASGRTYDVVTSSFSAALAGNGDLVVSGYRFNDFSNGDDTVVLRYSSPDGSRLDDVLDLGENDKAYATAVGGNGQIFVVGRSRQPGMPYEAMILKYDGSLSPSARQISLDNVNGLGAVAVLVLAEGNDNVLVGIEASTTTDSEIVIRKLRAADLSPVWTYRYDVPGAGDTLKGMSFDPEGRLAVLVQTATDNVAVLKIDRQGSLADNVSIARPGSIGVAISSSGPNVYTGLNFSNGTDQDAAVAMTGPPLLPVSSGSSDGGMCFIATAAWGSPMEKEVRILRRFRDGFLADQAIGRMLVAWYYRWGPAAARWIEGDPVLRGAARCVLVPVVMGASVAVSDPPLALGLLFAGFSAIAAFLCFPSWKNVVKLNRYN